MKKHHCSRCKKHTSDVVEVARKTGAVRTLCADCIATMERKGAKLDDTRPAADERRRIRVAAANMHPRGSK